jgi:hypothetical protein
MRILKKSLMLLVAVLIIGVGTPSLSGRNGANVNKNWPPCPPICVY